jgi:uncharacterized repeat protein (TIGR01451 family)
MMVNPSFTRFFRTITGLVALIMLVLFVRAETSNGTVVGMPGLAYAPSGLALAIDAPLISHASMVRARRAEMRATKIVRARCLREARTEAQRKPCRSQKVSLAIRRLASQNSHHEVVCHKGVGSGTNNWVAIPPDQTSAHLPKHEDDFIIFADYPEGAKWSDLKAALDTKCECAAPNPRIEPAPPTETDVCGTENDTYTIPVTTGVRYMVNGAVVEAGTYPGRGSVTIIAVAIARNVMLSGTATWTFTFSDAPCQPPVTPRSPGAPRISERCGPNNDLVALPTSDYFTYTSTGWVDNKLTVRATPKSGVVVTEGATTVWTFTDENEPCPPPPVETHAPPAPTISEQCGPNNDVVVLPESNYFTYATSGWSLGQITVIATPKTGVVVTEGAKLQWVFRDYDEPCTVVETPPAPTVSELCGPNNDGVVLPESTYFTYTSSGWNDNQLTVRATPKAGVVVTEGATTEWTFTDKAVTCQVLEITAPRPTVTPKCGSNNDVVIPPANAPDGVSYTIGAWSGNKATVTATAGPEITLLQPTTWTFTDAAVVCPTRLAVRKVGPGVASAKRAVTYTITVTNTGRSTAYNVVIRDFIPAGMVLASVPSRGTMAGGSAQWTIGTLAPGASRTVRVSMRSATNTTKSRCNTARASGSNAPAVRATACTRFVQVAGVSTPGVTG